MTKHFFQLSGRPPCPDCGGPEGVALNVGSTGYSCGTEFAHESTCPRLRCKHGVLHAEDCDACDKDRQAESDASERIDRVNRMEEIRSSHDLPGCMINQCDLCEEYYALLKKTYEEINKD